MQIFDREYLLSEINALRKYLSLKSFWKDNKPRLAVKGLLYVYANTIDLTEEDIEKVNSILYEYDLRLSLSIENNIYKNTLT